MALKQDFKDQIPQNGKRLYGLVDGSGSYIYRDLQIVRTNGNTQEGDVYGAQQVNEERKVLNQLSNPNLLINGDFQIWQRGDNVTQGNGKTYTADRWVVNISDNKTVVQRDSGGSGLILKPSNADFGSLGQYIEAPKESRTYLVGKKVTVSVRAKANRNITNLRIDVGNQNQIYTLSTVYQTISKTFTLTSNDFSGDNLMVKIMNTITNFQPTDIIYFAWATFEIGDAATSHIPRLYVEDLLLCSRYSRIETVTGVLYRQENGYNYYRLITNNRFRIVPSTHWISADIPFIGDVPIYTSTAINEKGEGVILISTARAGNSNIVNVNVKYDAEIYS